MMMLLVVVVEVERGTCHDGAVGFIPIESRDALVSFSSIQPFLVACRGHCFFYFFTHVFVWLVPRGGCTTLSVGNQNCPNSNVIEVVQQPRPTPIS